MSVLVKDRKESTMEFINTAHELEKFTIELTMRENAIPKKYRFILGKPLTDSVRLINRNVIYANSIKPKTTHDFKKRRK